MARLTYSAPGVYVEEVPSAQKPIAGVGTNTVAFIGVVPDDEIQYPVPNEAYDPQIAQDLADPQALAQDIDDRDEDIRTLEARQRGGQVPERLQKELDTKRRKLQDLRVLKLAGDLIRLVGEKRRVSPTSTTTTTTTSTTEPTTTPGEKPPEGGGGATGERAVTPVRTPRETAQLDPEIDAKKKEFLDLLRKQPSVTRELADRTEELVNLWLRGEPITQQMVDRTKELSAQLRSVLLVTVKDNILKPYTFTEPYKVTVDPGVAKLCTSFSEYTQRFGSFSVDEPGQTRYLGHRNLTHAVYGFFNNGGTRCFVVRIKDPSELDRALETIESIDAVAIVAAPGLYGQAAWDSLVRHCEKCGDRFAILDCPPEVETGGELDLTLLDYGTAPSESLPQPNKNAAYYFPYIEVVDPAKQLQDLDPARRVDAKYRGRVYVPPSGHIAGIYARTDEERGVHKAPANSAILGALNVKYYIGKPKQELLNPQGVNCIRNMNGNVMVWGARTIGGDKNSEWKYINVRRLFLFLRESIDEGTQWVVFEPNDPALWGKIRRNLTAFLTNVWRSGALFGLTPEEAFYVKCDAELNPPEVRDLGQVITEIGVSIVRPAEFVIFRVTQDTGPRGS